MSAKIIFNTTPTKQPTVRNGLEYRVDARTKHEPKRVWPDKPTYKNWLADRTDNDAHREGYRAFCAENLSKLQEEELYKLLRDAHDLLRERRRIDAEYDKALTRLAEFGPIPPKYEHDISKGILDAVYTRRLGLRRDKD